MNFGANGDQAPQLQISQNRTPLGAVSLSPVSDNVRVMNTCDDTLLVIPAAVSVPQGHLCDGSDGWRRIEQPV